MIPFESEKKDLEKRVLRNLKHAQRRKITAEKELQESLNWESVKHEASLLQSFLYKIKKGDKQVVVEDWENQNRMRTLQIDPLQEPHKYVADLFKKSKKLQKAIPHKKLYLEKISEKIDLWNQYLSKLSLISSEEELDALKSKIIKPSRKKEKEIEFSKPYHQFISSSGIPILVGKSAAKNEILTFSIAKGNDWWLHVHGSPGSHIVIRTKKGISPDEETVLDAIQLALAFSKSKEEAEVVITQQKFVSRFGGGKQGKVHISKHKTVFAKKDVARLSRIKQNRKL